MPQLVTVSRDTHWEPEFQAIRGKMGHFGQLNYFSVNFLHSKFKPYLDLFDTQATTY